MSSVDWDEVKRLAADFQQAQLSSTSLTLSERNCIEIINKLTELNLLDVIYTIDGKEYITPQYLVKEIKDELYVSGGRINLVQLSQALNVDLSHVSAKASEVERSTPGCQLVIGQLIDKTYTNSVAQEINDKLKTQGKVNIQDLTRVYDLPSDFLQSVVERNMGRLVQCKQDKVDPRLFFTEAFVLHNKAVTRGALSALTKPTLVSAILSATELHERDFFSAFDLLNEEKQISGALTAKQGSNTMYIPYVYTKQQSEWVDNFYKQNGYLEYDALNRLGISDAVSFIRRHFPNSGVIELTSCAVGPQLLSQVSDSIEETILSGSYLDLSMLLPSVFESEDVSKVLNIVLKQLKTKAVLHTFCDSILVTEKFLSDLSTPFEEHIKAKSEEVVKSGAYIQSLIEKKLAKSATGSDATKIDKKEERRKKAATGKGGGGTQGRETKTRSTKKKQTYTKGKEDSDEEIEKTNKSSKELEFFALEDIESILSKNSALSDEDNPEFISALATHLWPVLNKRCAEAAAEVYERSLLSSAGSRRKIHSDLQEKVDNWMVEVRLGERGVKGMPSSMHAKLSSHLLKTTCTTIVNHLISYLSEDNQPNITPELRNKIINDLSGETKDVMQALNACLSGQSVDEFLSCLEAALPEVDLVPRKMDKKKEKAFLLNRRELLLAQIAQTDDPADLLHVAVVLLLQYMTQTVVHMSSKFVPSVLPLLRTFLAEPDFEQLSGFQEQVLKLLSHPNDEELQNQIRSQLNEKIVSIRDITMKYKKQSVEK